MMPGNNGFRRSEKDPGCILKKLSNGPMIEQVVWRSLGAIIVVLGLF